MKPKLKIQFADMIEYQKQNNLVWRTLQEHYALELSEEPDILFYNVYGTGYEHYRYHDCIKVFMGSEASFPNFYECDYAFGRFDLHFGDRYCRLLDLKWYDTLTDRSSFADTDPDGRRFCNFIYHNAKDGDGARIRQQFCKQLMQYKPVDCPGKVLNNMQTDALTARHASDWGDGKRAFIGGYKFTIAFENQGIEGYTTEKMTDPLAAGSVPIYWGNRRASDLFNEQAFVNAMDGDFDAVIERIVQLDRDPQAYKAMLMAPSIHDEALFKTDWLKVKSDFILSIADHGTRISRQDHLLHDYTTPVMTVTRPFAEAKKAGERTKGKAVTKIRQLQKKLLSK